MEYEDQDKQREEGRKAAEKQARTATGKMTLRERFQRVMHYQHADKLPNFEFWYWDQTLPNWRKQGLPESVGNVWNAYEYFGIEQYHSAPVNTGLKIPWKTEVIEDTEERQVSRDVWGAVSEINKKGNRSIPRYLEFPIKDRATWEPFKASLLDDSGRYPDNWDELAEKYRTRDYPLAVGIGSLIGVPRNLIGFQNIALMICEQPELIEEIVETFCDCVCRNIVRAAETVQFDLGAGWEDICFNSGPIVGVPFFRDVLAPRYKRITDILHVHGVDIVHTDCDGNLTHVIPHFLEGGINTTFPTEVNAGTDPVALRKTWGRELRFIGGVDKMILRQDKAAVDRELTRLRPVVEDGGFIPHIDHLVPADAKLDVYKHYLDRKREWFNVGGEPKY